MAMDVSTENVVGYICITVIVIVGMIGFVLIAIFGGSVREDEDE